MYYRCKRCLTPITRPRIKFDVDGVCFACKFWDTKVNEVDWKKRRSVLKNLCDTHRRNDGRFDVVVPVGGGKDSSYVAWTLKTEFGMNPLGVCAVPPLETELGRRNLRNFVNSGFSVIEIHPNRSISRKIARRAFTSYGTPQQDWLTTILTIPFCLAVKFDIPLVMFGEEAESEYGGSQELEKEFLFSVEQARRLYLSGLELKALVSDPRDQKGLYWLNFPTQEEVEHVGIMATHWSYFEPWDEYKHFDVARKYCGLQDAPLNTSGAYNKSSHVDQTIYYLHMYLAYLKYGFGRATTDASIDIRYGKITREEGLNLVRQYDHVFPEDHLDEYLDYLDYSASEFFEICETFRNKEIFTRVPSGWKLNDNELASAS